MCRCLLSGISRLKESAKRNAVPVMAAAVFFVAAMVDPAFAASAENAKNIFKFVVQLLAIGAIAGGVIMGVTGAIAYAEAKSEGEGPGMAKARNQLIAAVMLAVVGVALSTSANTLAGYIETSISL